MFYIQGVICVLVLVYEHHRCRGEISPDIKTVSLGGSLSFWALASAPSWCVREWTGSEPGVEGHCQALFVVGESVCVVAVALVGVESVCVATVAVIFLRGDNGAIGAHCGWEDLGVFAGGNSKTISFHSRRVSSGSSWASLSCSSGGRGRHWWPVEGRSFLIGCRPLLPLWGGLPETPKKNVLGWRTGEAHFIERHGSTKACMRLARRYTEACMKLNP